MQNLTPDVINIYRRDTPNRGDIASAPSQYFPEFGALHMEITGWKHKSEGERKKWMTRFNSAKLIIVGGGGLLEFEKHRESLEMIMSHPTAKKVLWGAGHNSSRIGSWYSLKAVYQTDYSRFDLIGVRDYGHGMDWVPCASCMSPAFDKKYEIEKEFVFFANLGSPDYELALPEGVRESSIVSNLKTPLPDIVAELAKAETIVTSSYHGAYWGQLLGRKVVAIPTSSKFYDMRFPVPICSREDWRRYLNLARSYPEALDESRDANKAFAERVFNL